MSDEAVTGAANYCEFISPMNPTEKVLLARAGILVFTAALLVAMLAVTLKTIPAVSFMLGVILVFCAWFVWQFTKIEYEYTVATGAFLLDKIYGARTRKKILEFGTSDLLCAFAPEKLPAYEKDAESVLWACKKDDAYALGLLYTVGSEKRILMICAPERTRTCLKYYRRNIFAA